MDPAEVARLVEELKLSAEAKDAVVNISASSSRPDSKRLERVVVGKIFDTRVVNRETLRTHLPRILQTRREPEIEIVGDNLFAVVFGSEEDRSRALHDGPWHFFKCLMIFNVPVGLQHPSEMVFDEFTTWIQCHNLPISCMQLAVVRSVGEKVGKVLKIDVNEDGSCLGQFARIRVARSVAEPLQRCVRISLDGGTEQRIVLIRYEKLPDFCYSCGRVGHVVRHCYDQAADKVHCVFGQWLRAGRTMDTRRPRNTSNGRGPGYGRGESSGDAAASEAEGIRPQAEKRW